MVEVTETQVSAALIRGETPKKIARRLAKQGVPPAEIERLLEANGTLLQGRKVHHRGRGLSRIAGLVICLAAMALNVYFMFFLNTGWAVYGLSWAVGLYGLLVILFGDFGGGLLRAIGADGDKDTVQTTTSRFNRMTRR